MKTSWQTKTLGEILLKTETVNPAQSPDDEFEYVDVSSVSNESFAIEATQRLKGKDAPSRARRLVRSGDVIFATIRPTLKRIAVVPPELDGQVCSTGYFVLRPCREIDHRYLFYSLFTERFMGAMESLQKGASYPAVTDAEVRSQEIAFPPVPEQRRIVTILDEAFEAIATAKANAEKNLQNSRELYECQLESLFASGCGKWPEPPLEQVAGIINGYAFQSTSFQRNPGVRSIKITNVGVREFVDDTSNFLPDTFSQIHAAVAVPKGSIVLALTRTIIADGLKVAVVPEAFNGALLNQRVAAIQPHAAQLETPFLLFYLSTRRVTNYVKSRVNTLMQPNLSIGDLRRLPIPLPLISVQRELVAILNRLDEDEQNLESVYDRKLAALDELKRSLLHHAFTGQLTTNNAEDMVEAVA